MSDNLSFLLTCAAECLNNWGYDGHGKHVDDGVKEITRLRAENEKLREELEEMREACQANYMLGVERGKEDARDIAAAALKESGAKL